MIDKNAQRLLARDAQLCSDEDEALIAMRSLLDRTLANVHTCCPGIIDHFYPESQTVQVKPAIHKLFFPDGEEARWVELAPLVDVPVISLAGAGYALTFPIRSGDECLLLFAERAIDNWYQTGEASEPPVMRRHDSADAFALVGIRSQGRLIASYNTEEVELRSLNGQTRIRLSESGAIYLQQGNTQIQMSGGQVTINASTVHIEGQLTVSGDVRAGGISLRSHTHGGVYPGGSVTGPPQ